MNITYTEIEGFNYPNLTVKENPELELGQFAQMRERFLQEHRKITYTTMMTDGTLDEHLAETERRAQELTEQLTEQMKAERKATEELKKNDQLAWVQEMNNIANAVREIVYSEVI